MGLRSGNSRAYVLIVLASALARASAQYGGKDGGSDGYGSGDGGNTLSPSGGGGGTEVFVGSLGNVGTDCDCPSEVEYVCGSDGNTYDNTCMAQCAGVKPVFQGACYNGCMCFSVLQPLCLVPDQTSFLNICLVDCKVNSADPITDFLVLGECTGACVDCPRTKSTVCDVSPEGEGNEWVNSCYAECQGVSQWQPGCCDKVFGLIDDCDDCSYCNEDFDYYDADTPVCGIDNVTYNNACLSQCTGGVPFAYTGPCETNCDACAEQGGPEVCGVDGVTYTNACEARCAPTAVNTGVDGGCENVVPGCGCSAEVLEPVCAESSNTYMNACFAECASEVVVSEGPCEYNSDYVDGPYDGYGNPVAVVDGVVVNV